MVPYDFFTGMAAPIGEIAVRYGEIVPYYGNSGTVEVVN